MALSTEEISSLVSMLNENISVDTIEDYAEKLSFKGFNPLKIYKAVYSKIKSDASVKQSLYVMIVFGLTRGFGGGKSWQNILDKTNPAGRDILQNAKDKLEVKLTRPEGDDTVTVPRLMQVFSFYTYKIFCILTKLGKIRAFNYEGSLPQKLRWIGSSACMSPAAWAKWSTDYVEFSVHCSKVWNKPQDADTALRFACLAYQTNTWLADKRLSVRDLRKPLIVEDEEEEEDETDVTPVGSGKAPRLGEK